jgi:hypothetical protein
VVVVLGAHYVGVVAAGAGVDPHVVKVISLVEEVVFIASFAGFFWGTLVRIWDTLSSPRRGGNNV